MADPFLGEVRMFGFNFPPQGWALCDGTQLQISQNNALYSLLGIRYGGDGRTYFNLPDLRGRVPMHRSPSCGIGQKGGSESVALTINTTPAHNHSAYGTTTGGDSFRPGVNKSLATSTDSGDPVYGAAQGLVAMHPGATGQTGGGQSHNNMQPSLVINFCIATTGIYPPRS